MGASLSENCTLTSDETQDYANQTHFNETEVKALWHHFRTISTADGLDFIGRDDFQAALRFRDSFLLDRIFKIFDKNADGQITFMEFLFCLSTISSKATQHEKLQLSFQIYDMDTDGYISVNELTKLLTCTLREHELKITEEEIDTIVETTFKEADVGLPGMMTFTEFENIVSKTPYVLTHLTLDISKIIEEYCTNSNIAFTPRS